MREAINYHINEAAYCRMVRLQGWGRSPSFKRMWQQREKYHRRIIKSLRKAGKQ